jgi:hypothetical protein
LTSARRRDRSRRHAAHFGFALFWARLLVIVGAIAIGAGIVFAGIALFIEDWRAGVSPSQAALERALLAGSLIVSGFLAGSPFIVFGQLLHIFLDQRILLERIHRVLRLQTRALRARERPT